MKKNEVNLNIDKEKFEFVQDNIQLHDSKFDTKPVGYYKDAWRRFKKNKASVVAACIIICLVLFSLIVPIFSSYTLAFSDPAYKNMLPKNKILSNIGIADGINKVSQNQIVYDITVGIGVGAADHDALGQDGATWTPATISEGLANKYSPVVGQVVVDDSIPGRYDYDFKLDTYKKVGFNYYIVTKDQYDNIRSYEAETGINIIYPMVDVNKNTYDPSDANIWFKINGAGVAQKQNGEFVHNYLLDSEGKIAYYRNRDSYALEIRVIQYEYFVYKFGHEPSFVLGTNNSGQDLFIRLAKGIQTSLMLAVFVAGACLIIGAIIGAIEGYYGGWVDLLTERVIDVILGIPFTIVITLFNFYLVITGKVSPFTALLFAFISTGWIGTSGVVRTQFYRFKRQEYVFAARTLGARDRRIMFKHIFPNAIGRIVTVSILAIPSVIFTETFLTYLGIVNLSGPTMSSLGEMLSEGQAFLSSFPHIVFFPALVISLLMISFNLFGNGLRDALNPTLRGGE